MIASIDPGASGAVAILSRDGRILAHCPMPTIKSGKTTRVNAAALAGFLRECDVTACYLERVGAMPGGGERRMGASSAFNFGHSAGVVEGVIAALGIPLHLVAPQVWKKTHGLLGKKDKDEARTLAARLYPGERTFDLKGKGQALADAVLLGLHGLKQGARNGG